jgi:hypothetical protein
MASFTHAIQRKKLDGVQWDTEVSPGTQSLHNICKCAGMASLDWEVYVLFQNPLQYWITSLGDRLNEINLECIVEKQEDEH